MNIIGLCRKESWVRHITNYNEDKTELRLGVWPLDFFYYYYYFASNICFLLLACDLITRCNDYDLLVTVLGNGLLSHRKGTRDFNDSILRKCSQLSMGSPSMDLTYCGWKIFGK